MFDLPNDAIVIPEGKGQQWADLKRLRNWRSAWLQAINQHVNTLQIEPLLLEYSGQLIVVVDFTVVGCLRVQFYRSPSGRVPRDRSHEMELRNCELFKSFRYWGLVTPGRTQGTLRIRREVDTFKTEVINTNDLLLVVPMLLPDSLILPKSRLVEIFRQPTQAGPARKLMEKRRVSN